MTDKELLELAAKAAGIEVLGVSFEMDGSFAGFPTGGQKVWNPLTDDGDALRLAVKLEMNVDIGDLAVEAAIFIDDGCERISAMEYWNDGDDPYAATRRAIVRAAAQIGRSMG